jgi:hypothetical protein
MMKRFARAFGRRLANYLNQPLRKYESFDISDPARLAAVLRPADVLLVDGNARVSTAIKYLTQSTWSHAALFVGEHLEDGRARDAAAVLIEADLVGGVIAVPLEKYARLNTRICRPVSLDEAEARHVCQYAIERLGHAYDLRNVFDLARYLLPVPPVPAYWRRRMLALGSGDPTRAICSTLIAQAFQSVRYPILPQVEHRETGAMQSGYARRAVHHIRHYSLFVPRDFDISPFFQVVKPTLEAGFDHRTLAWADTASGPDAAAVPGAAPVCEMHKTSGGDDA